MDDKNVEELLYRTMVSRLDGLRRNASFEQPKYAEAREAGDTDVAAVIVGEAVDLVHTEETASDIVSRICSDAETLLRSTGRFLG